MFKKQKVVEVKYEPISEICVSGEVLGRERLIYRVFSHINSIKIQMSQLN